MENGVCKSGGMILTLSREAMGVLCYYKWRVARVRSPSLYCIRTETLIDVERALSTVGTSKKQDYAKIIPSS